MNLLSPPGEALHNVVVVLSHPTHPGNIGAAARAMKTMGLRHLRLVRPKAFPHPDASARASGATDVLDAARVCDTLAAALEGTVIAAALTSRRRELSTPPLWARDAARQLAATARQGMVALVFGNETFGLSNEEVALCRMPVMIPANPEYASLNLAAAVQILCYELRMAAVDPGLPPAVADAGELAPAQDVERFHEHLERSLIDVGFLDPSKPGRLMLRLRRIFSRTGLDREEINILRGMLSAFERSRNKVD